MSASSVPPTAPLDPPYGDRDRGGMAARIAGIPKQIDDALARVAASPWRIPAGDFSLLAIGAMGGSAIAGELTAALLADRSPRPILVTRDYRWPAYVSSDTLALICSYSGDTEEALALYRGARERSVPRLAIASGGALASLCEADGVHCMRVPGGSPPRAALFGSWVPLTFLLHGLGWADDPRPAWGEARARLAENQAQLGPESAEDANPAKRLARQLVNRLVLVYAGTERTGAVATRVRHQLNENAKVLGHSAAVPELNHNEIVGWERPGALHRQVSVLILRDAEDAPEVALRLSLTAEYAKRQGAEVHEWTSSGISRLARMASLVQFGDWLSFYLALATGADPTPIPSIDEFKQRLSRGAPPRA